MTRALTLAWIFLVISARQSLRSPWATLLFLLINILTWPLMALVLCILPPQALGPFGDKILRHSPSLRQQKKILGILVEIGHLKPVTPTQLAWLHAQGRAMHSTSGPTKSSPQSTFVGKSSAASTASRGSDEDPPRS